MQGKSSSRETRRSASRDSTYAEGLLVSTRFLGGFSGIPVVLLHDSQLLFADGFLRGLSDIPVVLPRDRQQQLRDSQVLFVDAPLC